jgi:glycine betaine/proline transport system substrate-binding protein
MRKLLLALLVLTLFAAACGDDSDSEPDTSGDDSAADDGDDMAEDDGDDSAADDGDDMAEDDGDDMAADDGDDMAEDDGDKPTISLVVNPWTASALNVAVAQQLIESELGYPTEVINIDENEAMFIGLADGTADAVLEIWPSGITDSEQAFFDDGSVVHLGELGAVGRIGWFVPDYVIDENPELATWEGYFSDEAAAIFATAQTGDNGRFLGTDPSYSQFDEQIINNLGMPFEVIYSGSEPATVAELDARVSAGEPILMYWWTPTAAVSTYSLVQVTLPPYTEECGASAASGDGGVDCEYPEDVIIKAVSGKLADKAPDVYDFLSAFTITNADQLSMLPPVELDGEDVDEVAAQWIADNEDVWSAWIG